jgi:hypothetical protein
MKLLLFISLLIVGGCRTSHTINDASPEELLKIFGGERGTDGTTPNSD